MTSFKISLFLLKNVKLINQRLLDRRCFLLTMENVYHFPIYAWTRLKIPLACSCQYDGHAPTQLPEEFTIAVNEICPIVYEWCLPENITQSIESGSFLRVSSVVLHIFPTTFNLTVLPKWTSSKVFVNISKADFSSLRLSRSCLTSSRALFIG